MMRPNVATYQMVRRSRSLTSRWMPSRDELASVAKAISGSANRLNQLDWIFVVDFAAEASYQHLENVGERIVVLIPDVRRDRGAIDHLSRVQHEELEQRELLRRQLDLVSGAAHSLSVQIHLEVGDVKGLGQWRATASRQRPHARQEREKGDGLGGVAAPPPAEPRHSVIDRIARGQHQDGRRDPSASELPAEIEAAPARKHHVENDYVECPEHC